MNSKEANIALKKGLKKMLIYTLISLPLTFFMIKVIELKYTKIFWTFMVVMGISGFIADWYEAEEEKSRFVKMMEHIAIISFMVLMFQSLYFNWFTK